MEYAWNYKKLEKLKKETYDLLRKTQGLTKEEKETIKIIIQYIKDLEEVIKPKRKIVLPERIKYLDKQKLLSQITYEEYDSIPYFIKEIILKATYCLKDLQDTYQGIELPKVNISPKGLVELCHDFYEWLPNKNYIKEVDHYLNPKNNLIQFIPKTSDPLMGETTFFYYPTYQPYFLIERENTINDLITLNHEIAHGIFKKLDTTKDTNGNHFYLMELEGSFFDFLTIEYLKEILPMDQIKQLEYQNFITSFESFSEFFMTDSAIKLLEKKKEISIIPIQKRILKLDLPFYLDESILIASLEENPANLAKYLFSYLTSLDLQEIYQNDPEQALKKLETIRNNKTNNIYQNLESNQINFIGEKENYKPLQKTIQKINHLGEK